jgi:putative DNA primase/helicase
MRSSSSLPYLLRIAQRGVPFTSSDGQAFVRLAEPFSGGFYILPVRSPAYRHWLFCQFFAECDAVPSAQAVQAVLNHLEAQAHYAGDNQCLAVWRRVGARGSDPVPSEILLDLANPDRQFVTISAERWDVSAGENALFQTSRSTAPLPSPVPADPGPPLAALRACLNLPDRAAWIRCLAWLLSALRPYGPFPFLILQGPAASGKTFAARVLRSLIDPNTAPLTPIPSTVRDLLAVARQNWVLAFDHVSALAPQLPDALCRLSTGLGASLRETPHFEPEPLLQSFRRPVLFTATPRWSPPLELAERALIVSLPPLPPANRLPETELLATLSQFLPAILGSLCSAVSTALRRLPDLPLASGRLPDAFAWILAASPALACPGEPCFTEDEIRDAFALPVPRTVEEAVRLLLQQQPRWSGTASQLFELLSPLASCCSPKVLSEQLRESAPTLAAGDITVKFRRAHEGVRIIDLFRKSGDALCQMTPSDPASPPQLAETEDLLAA